MGAQLVFRLLTSLSHFLPEEALLLLPWEWTSGVCTSYVSPGPPELLHHQLYFLSTHPTYGSYSKLTTSTNSIHFWIMPYVCTFSLPVALCHSSVMHMSLQSDSFKCKNLFYGSNLISWARIMVNNTPLPNNFHNERKEFTLSSESVQVCNYRLCCVNTNFKIFSLLS